MTENDYGEFSPLVGKVVRIDSEHHELPIFGRLLMISSQFLTIQRRDGRITLIKRKTVLAIEATKNQDLEVI